MGRDQLISYIRLGIHKNSSWSIVTISSFKKWCFQITNFLWVITIENALMIEKMLPTELFPIGVTHLNTGLPDM